MRDMAVLLLLAHLLADFPLQGDFMARAKNHRVPIPGIPWRTVLAAHAGIHAALVHVITGSAACAAVEFVVHAATDWLKCDERISFNADQCIHVTTKLVFILALGATDA